MDRWAYISSHRRTAYRFFSDVNINTPCATKEVWLTARTCCTYFSLFFKLFIYRLKKFMKYKSQNIRSKLYSINTLDITWFMNNFCIYLTFNEEKPKGRKNIRKKSDSYLIIMQQSFSKNSKANTREGYPFVGHS